MAMGRNRRRSRARYLGGSVAPAPAFISAVSTNGYQATYNGTTGALTALELVAGIGNLTSENWSGSPTLRSITVTRRGFDDAGASASFGDTIYMAQRLRLPSQFAPAVNTLDNGPFTFDGLNVVLSERVYEGDSISGCTNNSTLRSPKPLGAWTTYDRETISNNSLTLGAVFAHWAARNGRQVRAVEFYATDGVTTVQSGKILNPTLSSFPGDAQVFPHWTATLDISSLANGRIRAYCIAWPWVGRSDYTSPTFSSVLDSRDEVYSTDWFRFCDQYYTKAPAYPTAGSQWIAVVKATASGAPAVSQDIAAARTNFYGSCEAAIIDLQAANGGTLAGCRLLIADNVTWNQSTTQKVAGDGAFIIERDTTVARASAVLSMGSAIRFGLSTDLTAPLQNPAAIFRDLDITLTSQISAVVSGTLCIYDNCAVTRGSVSTATFWNSGVQAIYSYGTTWSNVTNTNLSANAPTAGPGMKHRGSTVNSTGLWRTNGFQVIGSHFTDVNTSTSFFIYPNNGANYTVDGQMHWYNRMMKMAGDSTGPRDNNQPITRGAAVISCLFEALGTSINNQPITFSQDSFTSNMNNIIVHNTTVAGFDVAGSGNNFYDDTDSTATKTFSCSIAANTPIAGQCTITLTAALVGGALVPGEIIAARALPAPAMTSDLTVVSGSGTIIGSTYVCTPSVPTRGAGAMCVPSIPSVNRRVHTQLSWKGNILNRMATKGDIFNSTIGGPGANNLSIAQASACRGNWEWDLSVGCADNNIAWLSNFPKLYYGINTRVAARGTTPSTNAATTETLVANTPSQWTNWQASRGGPLPTVLAGAGGGTYTLTAGHVAINLCGANLYTSHDLNGLQRIAGTNNSAGCYR